MTLVTISASYGAGGSRIAPALAERLGIPFLGRPPLPANLEEEDLGAEGDAGHEGIGAGAAGRLLSRLVSIGVAWGTPVGMTADELLPDQARRRELEQETLAFAASGPGVVLGRGAVVVLRDDPRALHVLLDGPAGARTARAVMIEGIDEATAARRLARVDRLRRAYLQDLYGVDAREPGIFDLVLDSTAFPLEVCVEIIATVARIRPERS